MHPRCPPPLLALTSVKTRVSNCSCSRPWPETPRRVNYPACRAIRARLLCGIRKELKPFQADGLVGASDLAAAIPTPLGLLRLVSDCKIAVQNELETNVKPLLSLVVLLVLVVASHAVLVVASHALLCARACMCVCVCVRACVRVCVCVKEF